MACDPATLVDDAKCLVAGMSAQQLLASIAFQLATAAGTSTDPAVLMEDSKCLWIAMSERQLLASIVSLLCAQA